MIKSLLRCFVFEFTHITLFALVIPIAILVLLILNVPAHSQAVKGVSAGFTIAVVDEKSQPVESATVSLLNDKKAFQHSITDAKGIARFAGINPGDYTISVTCVGFKTQITGIFHFPWATNSETLTLQRADIELNELKVAGRKALIEQKQGKVVLNVDASPSNSGTTILEVLEKSPGVMVDKNGGISLQGKPGVLVTIDDKPTYLGAADLNNLLSSMSSSQADQIELIANPGARYDASGNAGVINIKTKKNKTKGFNGVLTISAGQGVYPKNTDNLTLNFRSGKFNTFFNYSVNANQYFTYIFANRDYHSSNGLVTATLRQPTYLKGTLINNTIKTGFDYFVTPKTTIGMVFSGSAVHRQGTNTATVSWLNPSGGADSVIATFNKSDNQFRNGSINLNARQVISPKQEFTANVDYLHYKTNNTQSFDNRLITAVGYDEQSRGNIPTTINITAAKIDYSLKTGKAGFMQAGWKSSFSSTDNLAAYQNFDGMEWLDDNTKNNHFIYNENIHALYADFEQKLNKFSFQLGLRYEHTSYNAHQSGNVLQKDSAFTRNYGGLFPGGYISYPADSSNSFTLSAGRRIDRPAFQILNPFYFIINKYTYQTGNPYILPQYSWNVTLSHQYKNLLTSGISYSVISNYFSQLFLNDAAKGILLYSQGNVGHTYNLALSAALSMLPVNWWSFNLQAVYNYKKLAGFNGNNFTSSVNQLNVNLSNQFTVLKVYTAEINGFYTTSARNDIQEQLYPTGQLSLGIARPIFNRKGTLKFSARDILYSNAMEGLTSFPSATEYFKLTRDSRVYTIAFTYRFGKTYKTNKHNDNSASDEAQRAGNG